MVEVQLCFYKASLLNRILCRSRFGHVAVRLPSGILFNVSESPEFCGAVDESSYPWQPDAVVRVKSLPEWLKLALEHSEKPIRKRDLIAHNCPQLASLVLTGEKWNYDSVRYYADYFNPDGNAFILRANSLIDSALAIIGRAALRMSRNGKRKNT